MAPMDTQHTVYFLPGYGGRLHTGLGEALMSRGSDWILEVVDAAKNSHMWDDQFKTDQQAFDEAMRALDEEPLEFMETTSDSNLN
ncbi:MAG: hypothetical protein WCT47_22010 [Betaproteobacteria bacterium]|jgi:hypothetical protein